MCPGNWEGGLSCELDLRGSCGHLPVSSEGRRPPGLWGGGGGGPPAVRRVQGLRGRAEGGGDRRALAGPRLGALRTWICDPHLEFMAVLSEYFQFSKSNFTHGVTTAAGTGPRLCVEPWAGRPLRRKHCGRGGAPPFPAPAGARFPSGEEARGAGAGSDWSTCLRAASPRPARRAGPQDVCFLSAVSPTPAQPAPEGPVPPATAPSRTWPPTCSWPQSTPRGPLSSRPTRPEGTAPRSQPWARWPVPGRRRCPCPSPSAVCPVRGPGQLRSPLPASGRASGFSPLGLVLVHSHQTAVLKSVCRGGGKFQNQT